MHSHPPTEVPLRWAARAGMLYALVGACFVALSQWDGGLRSLNRILVPDATSLTPAVRLYAAVLGAVVLGFGVTLAAVARAANGGAARIAAALRTGLLAWFVVDTAASLCLGSWQNALFNTASLALALPPLVLAARVAGE